MSQTYVDVCPLLDQPSPRENYTQPVQVNRNIELVTRNLPFEVQPCKEIGLVLKCLLCSLD